MSQALNINITGRGKPLVFFHGWGFDHRVWLGIANLLKEQFTLYLVDLPGFGHSPAMDWESFKSRLLPCLPAQFSLAGWSMGGLFATRLAIEQPSRVSHLVNIASSPCFIKNQDWPGIERNVLDDFYSNLRLDPGQTLRQFIRLQSGANYDHFPHAALPEGLESGLEVLANWDLRQHLAALNLPACYMFGRLDGITPKATLRVMQEKYPSFEYVMFDKSAHIPFLTETTMFLAELKRWLA